jgi:hypothetical protein
VFAPISGCIADVGIFSLWTPNAKDCWKFVPITVLTKNYGKKDTTGTITLYKNGAVEKTWSNVLFKVGRFDYKFYNFVPAGYAGMAIKWKATVVAPGDPNSANNTSPTRTMMVTKC